MGWSSGSEVFEPVANALAEVGASAEVAVPALRALIRALQERGWDTEEESLGLLYDRYPPVVEAFAQEGIHLHGEELEG